MSPEILTYLSNKHKHSYTYYISNDDNSSYETSSIEKKSFKRYHLKPQIKEYLSNTLTKLLLSIIFLLLSIILIKSNSRIKEFYTEEVLTKQLNFTKFNNLYNKYLGNILPDYTIPEPTKTVMNNTFSYLDGSPYLNGTKITTEENYLIPTITSGIIVFLGDKDTLGPTCIIQGVDGVDIWYSNIDISSLNLYDYVTEGKILAPTESDYFYLTIDSNGTYLTYDTYKS